MTRGEPLAGLRSEIPELVWPVALGPRGTELLALLYQLERSEWWTPDQLRTWQLRQFEKLARYAAAHSDFHRERLRPVAPPPGESWDEARLGAVPILTRAELTSRVAEIHSRIVPQSHGAITVSQTSGSTGQPVSVRRTAVTRLMWSALNLRDHLWHRRDVSRTLAIIRAGVVGRVGDPPSADGWGEPASLLFDTGACHALQLDTDLALQVDWLLRVRPGYLITYPTNLAGLIDRFERRSVRLPGLVEVRSMGETLPDGLRERCRTVLGAEIVDSYSSQELGSIALQCPASGLYHVHAESLLVEVLDSDGKPASSGDAGRVVVTDLHNFATPLIRYELRDFAEPGPPCPCGRGLPTLRRILGRQRNMVALPNGERRWPLVGFARYREVADIVQYQIVQHSLDEIEMRFVLGSGVLSDAQAASLAQIVQRNLRHPFTVRFTRFDAELPGTRSGKFEEFVSLLD